MEIIGELERGFASSIYPNRVPIAIAAVAVIAVLALVAWQRRWDRPVRRHPGRAAIGAAGVLAVAGPLGWYLGSPLVLSTTVDEPPPIAAAVGQPAPVATATPRRSAQPTATAPTTASPSASSAPTPVPPIELVGTFKGADDFHFGQGTARLIETAPGSFTVRLEDFAVRNGPDLHVYLSPSGIGVEGAIELGRLKADRGNQNYVVPDGSRIPRTASVLIWCKQFAVRFATARLA
jgi:hypothetical protein